MPPPTPRVLLHSLKSTDLKHIAHLIGHNTTGTKACLLSQIPLALSPQPSTQPQRILSIDMGIRNLAYCVLDIPSPPRKTPPLANDLTTLTPTTDLPGLLSSLTVTAWRRTAVSSAPSASAAETGKETFDPSTFAKLAYKLVAHTLLPYKPTHILIERQRWRSGGAPAVLEWTVRVNMFESMLHAVFETLAQQFHSDSPPSSSSMTTTADNGSRKNILSTLSQFPTVTSVSPKKVANFWIDSTSIAEPGAKKAASKSKIEKEAKIAVAEAWLRGGLTCLGDAESTKVGFLGKRGGAEGGSRGNSTAGKGVSRRKSIAAKETAKSIGDDASEKAEERETETETETEKPGKLDDLADCLLQAVAWAQWEANRRKISQCVDTNADAV